MKRNIVPIHMNRQLIALRCLAQRDRRTLIRTLMPTLPWATAHERPAIASLLLSSGDPAAIAAVLRFRDQLGDWLDAAVERLPDRALLPALEHLAESGSSGAAIAASTLFSQLRPSAVTTIGRLILNSEGQPSTQRVYAEALLRSVLQLTGPYGCSRRGNKQRAACEHAVLPLLQQYDAHRCSEVALAGLLLAIRPGPEFQRVLSDDAGHAELLRDLRRGLHDLDRVEVATNLLRWLRVPAVAHHAGRKLSQLRSRTQWNAALADSHLLLCARRRLTLRAIERPTQCLPPRSVWHELSSVAQRALPVLIESLPLSSLARVRVLARIMLLDLPHVRLRAVELLAAGLSRSSESPPPDHVVEASAVLRRLVADSQPLVSRVAWLHARVGDSARSIDVDDASRCTLLRSGISSSDHWTVDQARYTLASQDVEHFFLHWLDLPQEQRFLIAHKLHCAVPHAMLSALLQQMESDDRHARLQAIEIIRRLGLAQTAESALIEVTHVQDPFVASAAIGALAEGRSPQVDRVLRDALDHGHPRVRANAVEGLVSRHSSEPIIEILRPLTYERDNRVRANAIVAEARIDPHSARALLASMLRDEDPMHRISGLWAVARICDPSHQREVCLIAERDPVEEVRRRAARTIPRIAIGRSRRMANAIENDGQRAMQTT